MKVVQNYYNTRNVKYGISGDRKGKILSLISPFKNLKVLDVGCAGGYIGEYLKKRNNFVEGWDINVTAVKKAQKILDKACVVDLESNNWPKPKEKYDLIIFSEVIEHLFLPETVLPKLLNYLKPGGLILITTPNILHLYIRLKTLMGKWDYEEESVINKAHLHFFTYNTLLSLAEKSGLKRIGENHVIFPRTLSSLWKKIPGLFAYQLIFLFQKADEDK